MKRFISLILTAALLVSCISMTTMYAQAVKEPSSSFGGYTFNNGGQVRNPIVTSSSSYFSGVFDGNGYTINRLYQNISLPITVYGGLSGNENNRATVNNLGMIDSNITAESSSSASAGGNASGENTYISKSFRIAERSYGYLPGSFNYYNQLNNGQKTIYNALKSISPSSPYIDIALSEPITFTSSSENPTEEEWEPVYNEITCLVQGALDALLKDYPEIFWLKFGAGGSSYGFSGSVTPSGEEWIFAIDSITFVPVLMDIYIPEESTIVSALNNAVNSFPVAGDTRYEKLLSIHDRLANTVAYDTYYSSAKAHEPYGALIDGIAVCEGYAEAFKLICDRESIPCVLVVGEGVTTSGSESHMWNLVQMEDGNWYGVDVTWDDQTENDSRIYYDFFLIGANTESENFGGYTFNQSHISDGNFTGTDFSPEFFYPPLSLTKYVPGLGVTKPTKLTYLEFKDALDVTGGKIKLYYNNGTSEEIAMTADMISGFDNTVVGKQTLTVTYQGKTATFEVEIIAKSLSFISVTTEPTKLEYLEGMDSLDVTGGKITLYYNNDTSETVDMTSAMVTGFDNTVVGTQTLTVSYGGKTSTFEIEIIETPKLPAEKGKVKLLGATRIVFTETENIQYSIDRISWQNGNVITGLDANTEYRIYVRRIDSVTGELSGVSEALIVKTLTKDSITGVPDATELTDLIKQLLTNGNALWADINADSLIDIRDLLRAKKIAAGLYDEYSKGDINEDGNVDETDALLMTEYLNGNLENILKINADMNDDGVINNSDLELINNMLT